MIGSSGSHAAYTPVGRTAGLPALVPAREYERGYIWSGLLQRREVQQLQTNHQACASVILGSGYRDWKLMYGVIGNRLSRPDTHPIVIRSGRQRNRDVLGVIHLPRLLQVLDYTGFIRHTFNGAISPTPIFYWLATNQSLRDFPCYYSQ